MKTIFAAIFLLVAGIVLSANAGDLPVPVRPPISLESTTPFRLQLTLPAPVIGHISLTENAQAGIPALHAQAAGPSPTSLHAGPAPAPKIISIEVNYPKASGNEKEAVLAKMRAKVGDFYSDNIVEEDTRTLTSTIKDVKRVRIFGVPAAGGVNLIVAVQPNGEFDFNVGYRF